MSAYQQKRIDEGRAEDRKRLGFMAFGVPKIMLVSSPCTDFALHSTNSKVWDAYYKMHRNERPPKTVRK